MSYRQSAYRGHSQFGQLRQFLLDTYQQFNTLRNWEPRRLEGTAFHNHPDELANVERTMRNSWVLWHNTDDQIVGALFSEYVGGFYPQLHPSHLDLIPQMLGHLTQHPGPSVDMWCHDNTPILAEALTAAGFSPTADYQNQKRLDLAVVQLVLPSLPSGYRIDTMSTDDAATDQMGHLLNSAFRRNIHSGAEYRTFQQLAPSYRTAFDTVIYDAHGTLVANAGITVHTEQSFAVVEPVATHPDHHRRGLARAAITHGLICAQRIGICTAWIEAWHSNVAANHTYNQVGFVDVSHQRCWRRAQP
jgi:ribosomal protein S18 acetylase RimI-like enzyme